MESSINDKLDKLRKALGKDIDEETMEQKKKERREKALQKRKGDEIEPSKVQKNRNK